MSKQLLDRLRKKARSSVCRTKIAAVAFTSKGEVLGTSRNDPRFMREQGGIHAEMALMAQYGKNIHHILILRVGRGGNLLPIEPCSMCSAKADELGIKITSVK